MPRILIVDDDLGVLRALGRLIHFMPRSALGGSTGCSAARRASSSSLTFSVISRRDTLSTMRSPLRMPRRSLGPPAIASTT